MTIGRMLAGPEADPSHRAVEFRKSLLDAVVDIAREAGRCIEANVGGNANLKDDGSPATAADLAADALLCKRLLALIPGSGWLSEETADSVERLSHDLVWIVDPLDGTKEFTQRLPEYAVAVALVDQQRPVLAVVHNPATSETFWASRDGGAFLNGERIETQSNNRLLASRSEVRMGEFAPFETDWDITAVGSIQYKLALVAAGKGALTFSRGPKHEWDVCAGALIVTEAGGVATDLFGNELIFNRPFPKTRGVLAGHPDAVASARGLLSELGGSTRMAELEHR